MLAYHPVAGVGAPPVAAGCLARLRERRMVAVLIGAQVPVLQDGEADAAGTAWKAANLLLRESVVGAARHAAVGADAKLGAAAKSGMECAVFAGEVEDVIIRHGREHRSKDQCYGNKFPCVFLAV